MARTEAQQPPRPGPELEPLQVFIGKWINEGQTVPSEGAPAVRILTSDVYEWAPGGFFVLHYAYGFIGSLPGGGIEILRFDQTSKRYMSHFFDSQGNANTDDLTVDGDSWTWTGESRRCTAIFTEQGATQTAHHERSDDGLHWVPSMEVTLRKVE